MIRPTGALAKYQFVVLAYGREFGVRARYEPQPFVLPNEFAPLLDPLQEYWQQESPDLKDGDTIISVDGVTVSWPLGDDARYFLPSIELHYRPTRYFQFLYSNYSLDVLLPGMRTLRTLYEQGAFGRFYEGLGEVAAPPSHRYWSYRFPAFGNSLGITVSVVTADNQLIVARRSRTAKGIARDKGLWLCAVGSQVKRHL